MILHVVPPEIISWVILLHRIAPLINLCKFFLPSYQHDLTYRLGAKDFCYLTLFLYRVKNIGYSGLSNQSLSEWLLGSEPKLYLLVLWEKMISVK